MYSPYYYSQINADISEYTPNTVHSFNNSTYVFWQRALFQRASSILKFDGMPEEWKTQQGVMDFFLYCILRFGFVAVSKDNERGLWFSPCHLGGYNFYYQPSYVTVSNPTFKGGSRKLKLNDSKQPFDTGKFDGNAELIKLTPDYMGIFDIVSYYAEKLTLLETSVNTSLINSKIPFILGGKTKSAVEALRKIIDKVNGGDPAVFYDTKIEDAGSLNEKDTPFHQLQLFDSSSYITDKLLEDRAKLLNAFDTEIGIQTLPFEKKERMVTDEANSKKSECLARVTVWKECLENSLEIVNKVYGTNISVEIRAEEVSNDGVEDNPNRNGELSTEL